MARNPTNWSNNNVKPPAGWSPTAKNPAIFVNNITKMPTAFTPVGKENTDWGNQSTAAEPWPYDSPTMKYDDTPLRGYNYLVPVSNTINGKIPTAFVQVI